MGRKYRRISESADRTKKPNMKKKSIKLMGDFSSSGLWCMKDGTMLSGEDLPITDTLMSKIEDWSCRWDKIFSKELDITYSKELNYLEKKVYSLMFYNSRGFKDLQIEQLSLGKLLKKEIGSRYRIFLFDDYKVNECILKKKKKKNFLNEI